MTTGTRHRAFRDRVRLRDRRCVITKKEVVTARHGFWGGFEATHIFPIAYQATWDKQNFSRWINIPAANDQHPINSVQNGLLLRSDIHQRFDTFHVSINPDV